jgi:hypothetical protein
MWKLETLPVLTEGERELENFYAVHLKLQYAGLLGSQIMLGEV